MIERVTLELGRNMFVFDMVGMLVTWYTPTHVHRCGFDQFYAIVKTNKQRRKREARAQEKSQ